jgi:hypothetical protein
MDPFPSMVEVEKQETRNGIKYHKPRRFCKPNLTGGERRPMFSGRSAHSALQEKNRYGNIDNLVRSHAASRAA